MKHKLASILILISTLAVLLLPAGNVSAKPLPDVFPQRAVSLKIRASANSYAAFIASVYNGDSGQAAGIIAQGSFTAPIVQQPSSSPGYVSTAAGTATQFGLAAQYETTALLAHNYLLGEHFFDIEVGENLSLVYGDGHLKTYRVSEVLEYQALSPNSPYSDFVDLNDPSGSRISVTDLFYRVYAQEGKLILQTCIEANGEPSWGRLFIIAEPQETVAMR